MPGFSAREVRQPRPYDIVGNPIEICGVGTGAEGSFAARIRDAHGHELTLVTIMAGRRGLWANFYERVTLPGIPATPQGTVEVFELSVKDGVESEKLVIPVIFGINLTVPYVGFAQTTVAEGDTLAALAQTWYGDPAAWPVIFEANHDQIVNPNLIYPGQTLRIPQ